MVAEAPPPPPRRRRTVGSHFPDLSLSRSTRPPWRCMKEASVEIELLHTAHDDYPKIPEIRYTFRTQSEKSRKIWRQNFRWEFFAWIVWSLNNLGKKFHPQILPPDFYRFFRLSARGVSYLRDFRVDESAMYVRSAESRMILGFHINRFYPPKMQPARPDRRPIGLLTTNHLIIRIDSITDKGLTFHKKDKFICIYINKFK